MNVNELMIGDWVRLSEIKKNGQVSVLSEAQVEIKLDVPNNKHFPWKTGPIQDFSGIPLTKEIILLNADRFSLKYPDEPIPFGFGRDKFFCGCENRHKIEVKYVHELQNFLRVIGCSNIAENFIIK